MSPRAVRAIAAANATQHLAINPHPMLNKERLMQMASISSMMSNELLVHNMASGTVSLPGL